MEERQAYIDRKESERKEIAAKIDVLRAKAAKADADARIAYNEQIDNLTRLQDKYAARIKELREAGEEAWQNIREGVEDAWSELTEGVRKASEAFK